MASKLQTFTRRRNWAKGRMASCLHQLKRIQNDHVLSNGEDQTVSQCVWRLENIINNWGAGTTYARGINGV